MKDVFSPIFLTSLVCLLIFHSLDIFFEILEPFVIILFLLAILFFFLKKFNCSYVFITLAISLLITFIFMKNKDNFENISKLTIPDQQYLTIEGVLTDFPELLNGWSVMHLKTMSVAYDKKVINQTFNLRVKIQGNASHFFKGDIIRIAARIYQPNFNENFSVNPFRNYVLYKKIHFNGYCKSIQLVQLLKKSNGIWQILGKWRNNIRKGIERRFSDHQGKISRQGIFLEAVLIGEKGKLSPGEKKELLGAGIYHLFAISGAHIGIIAIFSLLVLKFFRVPIRYRYFITLFVLVFFLMLSGGKISAQRAVFMAVLIFIARIYFLDLHIFNIISFCGLFILFLNPAEFLDPGFVLTFALTAAIVRGRNIFLNVFRRFPKYLKELISANLSASLISLPLSLFFFKRYSFAGAIVGVLLFPLAAIIIALGIFVIPLSLFSETLTDLILSFDKLFLEIFFVIVDLFSRVIKLSIYRASPAIFLVILIVMGFFILGSKSSPRPIRIGSGVIILSVSIFISLNLFPYNPDKLEVFYLDVGQGDSSLVVFPGGEALLVDGGGTYVSDYEIGYQIVLPFILEKRINVTRMAVSHYHPDHIKGILEIVNIIKPKQLWLSSEAKKNSFYLRLINMLDKSIEVKKITSDFSHSIGNCRISCLFPVSFISNDDTDNNQSQVIKISDDYHSFLFTGDIESRVENSLIKSACSKLRSDVLKVPHHGSRTSSTPDFLRCVKPVLAVFSFAKNNRFNFPDKEILKNYMNQGIKFVSTANRGGIKVISTQRGLVIQTSK